MPKTVAMPEPEAPARRKIDYVAKRLGLVAKTRAFRRTAHRFNRVLVTRDAVDSVQCFDLQGSPWNDGSEGQFCINLGIWFAPLAQARKELNRWDPGKEASRRGTHECHFRLRIDDVVPATRESWWPAELQPGEDTWFHVGTNRDLEQLAESLSRILETIVVPWFDARGSLEAVVLGLLEASDENQALALALLSGGAVARSFYASCAEKQADVEAWLATR